MQLRVWQIISLLGVIIVISVCLIKPVYGQTGDSLVVSFVGEKQAVAVPIIEAGDTEAVRAWLAMQPEVAMVGGNYRYEAVRIPNDAYYSSQNYLRYVNTPPSWDQTIGSRSVVVAVLDTGVDTNHPDLAKNIWVNTGEIPTNGIDDDVNGYIDDRNGWNAIDDSGDPNPDFDPGWVESGVHHGTAVAGIIGAVGNNGIGVSGVAWATRIMPVRVLDSTGSGYTVDVYNGIQYAIANGAHIINLSLVGAELDPFLALAINDAYAAGVLVVAAAGNDLLDLDEFPVYPACLQHVLTVGGVDAQNHLALFTSQGEVIGGSNYGSACIDLVAPAKNIFSTGVYEPSKTHPVTGVRLDDYYLGGWSGTSFASPIIAGAAALLKSYNASLTPDQLIQILKQNARGLDSVNPDYRGQMGSGLVNIAASVGWLLPSSHPIITAAGKGGGPHVRLFNTGGVLQSQFFAYATTFRGGVNVATGDIDGNGIYEIITGAGAGGAPHVRAFDARGNSLYSFFAYATTFRGGVNVAAGDVNGDGVDEIITGAGAGGAPHVRV
ncbi:MAG: S8 family serine peptidase, partial [Candidatus Kerfeldbacteria bacterium]|nr:S8 family serine peptidase [Candidatus Kerfeldbacteria bacterium]